MHAYRLQVHVTAIAVLAGVASASCGGEVPTNPIEAGAPAGLSIAPDVARAFAVALDDVRTRLLPALRSAGPALETAIAEIGVALDARDRLALVRSLDRAERALGAFGHDDAIALGAELDAVRLILSDARRAAAVAGSLTACVVYEISNEACQ